MCKITSKWMFKITVYILIAVLFIVSHGNSDNDIDVRHTHVYHDVLKGFIRGNSFRGY